MKPRVNWEIRTKKMTKDDLVKPDQTVTLSTPCGEIRGLQYNGYKLFRGVRYANAERFEPAVPVTAWDGVYDATNWGPRPMQFKAYFGRPNTATNAFYAMESLFEENAGNYSEEGSLNLNIWVPDNAENCPVLFYIHGGAFMNGSGTDPWIEGEEYAKHGVILVSVNYRLGPWHQAAGDGSKGNFCLTDQLTAIEWVNRNIKAYGGDPSRVVIAGESAGAMSVQCILFSPMLKEGMVSGGIIMSDGGSFFHKGTMAKVEAHWEKVKEKLGVKTLQELKDVPAVDVHRAWVGNTLDPDILYPVINGESRTCTVQEALAENKIANVPVIFGILSEDMYPEKMYRQAVEFGKARAAVGGKPTYVYYFDRKQIEDDGETFSEFGAYHAADLFYLFGTLYRNRRPYGKPDFDISKAMVDYISNFCIDGDPNGEGLAEWKPITADSSAGMEFGDGPCRMVDPDVDTMLAQEKKGIIFPFLHDWDPGNPWAD